jgi:hypothetical protein
MKSLKELMLVLQVCSEKFCGQAMLHVLPARNCLKLFPEISAQKPG